MSGWPGTAWVAWCVWCPPERDNEPEVPWAARVFTWPPDSHSECARRDALEWIDAHHAQCPVSPWPPVAMPVKGVVDGWLGAVIETGRGVVLRRALGGCPGTPPAGR